MFATVAIIAALCSSLFWALNLTYLETLPRRITALHVVLLQSVISLIVGLPLMLTQPLHSSQSTILLLLASGCVGLGLADSLCVAAIRRLGARPTLAIYAMTPLVTAWVGAIALIDQISAASYQAILLIVIALLFSLSSHTDGEQDLPLSGRRLSTLICGLLLVAFAVALDAAGALMSRYAMTTSSISPVHATSVRFLGGLTAVIVLLGRFSAEQNLLSPSMQRGIDPSTAESRARAIASRSFSLLVSSITLIRHYPLRVRLGRAQSIRWEIFILVTFIGSTLAILLQQVAYQYLSGAHVLALTASAPVFSLMIQMMNERRLRLAGVIAILLIFVAILMIWRDVF